MWPLVIAWFKVLWEAGIIRVADEFLLKRKRKKKEQKNEWNGGRKERKKGPRKEKGDPRVLRARYVRVRKWTERIKKEKEKKTNYLYIFILAWSNTCISQSCVRPRYFGESESCVPSNFFPVWSCIFVERETILNSCIYIYIYIHKKNILESSFSSFFNTFLFSFSFFN